MAVIPHIYKDAGLTVTFDDASDTLGASAVNGASADGVFYVGIDDDTLAIQAASNPGVDPLTVSIADAAPGSNVETTHMKLAVSQAALDAAVGGDPLNLGASINGGAVNAVPVWYRWTNSVGGGVATYTEITLELVERVEVAL